MTLLPPPVAINLDFDLPNLSRYFLFAADVLQVICCLASSRCIRLQLILPWLFTFILYELAAVLSVVCCLPCIPNSLLSETALRPIACNKPCQFSCSLLICFETATLCFAPVYLVFAVPVQGAAAVPPPVAAYTDTLGRPGSPTDQP